VEDNRNDYRYYGSITCAVSNGTTVDCKVPLCRQIDVGPPQCH
jgi:hypothetical protein